MAFIIALNTIANSPLISLSHHDKRISKIFVAGSHIQKWGFKFYELMENLIYSRFVFNQIICFFSE